MFVQVVDGCADVLAHVGEVESGCPLGIDERNGQRFTSRRRQLGPRRVPLARTGGRCVGIRRFLLGGFGVGGLGDGRLTVIACSLGRLRGGGLGVCLSGLGRGASCCRSSHSHCCRQLQRVRWQRATHPAVVGDALEQWPGVADPDMISPLSVPCRWRRGHGFLNRSFSCVASRRRPPPWGRRNVFSQQSSLAPSFRGSRTAPAVVRPWQRVRCSSNLRRRSRTRSYRYWHRRRRSIR